MPGVEVWIPAHKRDLSVLVSTTACTQGLTETRAAVDSQLSKITTH